MGSPFSEDNFITIPVGIETEFGLSLKGRGPEQQIQDAGQVVKACPFPSFLGWDYSEEHPRRDLRGFSVDRLTVDPNDQQFDRGAVHTLSQDFKFDTVLRNGARFYNDHGHPEYATPECYTLNDCVRQDQFGEVVAYLSARAYEDQTGIQTWIFKNNTDFHGASYGTHESYLIPRNLAQFDHLLAMLLPLLVVRPLLCGAGKVGSEAGEWVPYQISQRADFLVETANVETLFRRPLFNTRDEPHSREQDWVRLHVISGDANRMPACTRRKLALVQIAIHLLAAKVDPLFELLNAPESSRKLSRSLQKSTALALKGSSWTTAEQIFEGYFSAFEAHFGDRPELSPEIQKCRELLSKEETQWARDVEWCAKKNIIDLYAEDPEFKRDPKALQSVDLAWSEIDPESGLFEAVCAEDQVEEPPIWYNEPPPLQSGRARARALAVTHYAKHIKTANWHTITLGQERIELPPFANYEALQPGSNVEEFIQQLMEITRPNA